MGPKRQLDLVKIPVRIITRVIAIALRKLAAFVFAALKVCFVGFGLLVDHEFSQFFFIVLVHDLLSMCVVDELDIKLVKTKLQQVSENICTNMQHNILSRLDKQKGNYERFRYH